MEENQFTNDIQSPARPGFLSTLCILTWICSGLLFVSTIMGLLTQPSEQEKQLQIERMRAVSEVAAQKMEEAMAGQGSFEQIINQVLGLVGMGLSSLGAWLMWQLNKKGFYFYLAGELIPYIGMISGGKAAFAVFQSMGSAGNAIMYTILVLLVVSDAAFILMYGLNLKHMSNKELK